MRAISAVGVCAIWRQVTVDADAVGLQLGVAEAVAFERGAGVVVGVAVDFDHEALCGPAEVDFVAVDAGVGQWRRELGGADELEQAGFGF
jgi:hypothetical protein